LWRATRGAASGVLLTEHHSFIHTASGDGTANARANRDKYPPDLSGGALLLVVEADAEFATEILATKREE
jgi:hypothetical protein